MPESEVARLARDVESLAIRIRDVENVDTPYARQLVAELRTLQGQVADLREHGTAPSRRELEHLRDNLNDLKIVVGMKADADDVAEIQDELTSSRRMNRTALLGAVLALAGSLILFIIQRIVGR